MRRRGEGRVEQSHKRRGRTCTIKEKKKTDKKTTEDKDHLRAKRSPTYRSEGSAPTWHRPHCNTLWLRCPQIVHLRSPCKSRQHTHTHIYLGKLEWLEWKEEVVMVVCGYKCFKSRIPTSVLIFYSSPLPPQSSYTSSPLPTPLPWKLEGIAER